MVFKQGVAALIVTVLAFAIAANGVAATRALEDNYLRYNNMKQFQMLPKGIPIPPSGPSSKGNIPPPYPPTQFQMLPKGTPIPPSGPSRPPVEFQMLPKGTPIPPSGPSRPPVEFQMLPKGRPIPPSGPSPYMSDSPPPPSLLF